MKTITIKQSNYIIQWTPQSRILKYVPVRRTLIVLIKSFKNSTFESARRRALAALCKERVSHTSKGSIHIDLDMKSPFDGYMYIEPACMFNIPELEVL